MRAMAMKVSGWVVLVALAALAAGCAGHKKVAPAGAAPHDKLTTVELYRYDGAAVMRARERYLAKDSAVVPVVEELRANAEKAMTGGPWSVTYKKKTLPGLDKHIYVSIAPYWWPDETKKDGLPYVARDGERNPEFAEYDALPLMQLTDHVDTLVMAGYFTGEKKYFDRAALLIKTWFLEPDTRMMPSLDHGQVVKGVNEGTNGGVIEARRFVDIIDATRLLQGRTAEWTAEDDAMMKAWIAEFRHWMGTAKVAQDESGNKNNHGTWYDWQLVSYSLYVGDEARARQVLEAAKGKRIAVQIEPDGKQPLELARTRSYWYEEFNLNGLAALADLGRRPDMRVDLWNYQTADGRSIRKAIDWFLPYATGEREWTYKQVDGYSAKEMAVVLRRAEAAWGTREYEAAIPKLRGQDVATDNDREHPLWPRGMDGVLYPGAR